MLRLADHRFEATLPAAAHATLSALTDALAPQRLGAGSAEQTQVKAPFLVNGRGEAETVAPTSSKDAKKADATTRATQLIEVAVRHEWAIRKLVAAQTSCLAEAVELMPASRRISGAVTSTPQQQVTARAAPLLGLHPRTASVAVGHATSLSRELPRVMSLLREGRIDQKRATAIDEALNRASEWADDFDPGSARWLATEAFVASQAPFLTLRALERLLERILLQLASDGGNDAHRAALRGREIKVRAETDGMASIVGLVDAGTGQLLDQLLDAYADAMRDHAKEEKAKHGKTSDTRNHAQRRADAFALFVQAWAAGGQAPALLTALRDLATGGETPGDAAGSDQAGSSDPEPGAPSEPEFPRCAKPSEEDQPIWPAILDATVGQGIGTHLSITITDLSWLGLAQDPGLLDGHRSIPAALARRLGTTPARVTLIVLPGACGQLHREAAPAPGVRPCSYGLDHDLPETRRYRPSSGLVRLITARYLHCTFPGCTTPTKRCDFDHLQPFQRGGLTCACNVAPACRGHHQLKTNGGWDARAARPGEALPPGTIIWTTPEGLDHPSAPPLQPGMPGWSLPDAFPDPRPEPEEQYAEDLLSPAERTSARQRRWDEALDWHERRQEKRARAAAARLPWLLRTKDHPWGEPTGTDPDHGAPPF